MGSRPGREAAITMEEVGKHASKDDAWIVLFGEAIDVTSFLPRHPGGEDNLLTYLGKDATQDWQQIHELKHLENSMAYLKKLGVIQKESGLVSWIRRRLLASTPTASGDSASNVGCGADGTTALRSGGQADVVDSAAAGTDSVAEQGSGADIQDDEERPEPVRWSIEYEAELPPGGLFDLAELSRWDGVERPMCIGVCGLIVDVSSSENFVPGFGYGKLWAGRDTTWAMAHVSLKPGDANRIDFKLGDLGEEQFKALAGWYKHFVAKYRQVGTLREYRDWDFSEVFRKADELPSAGLTTG